MRVWLFWHVDCGRRTGGRNLWLLLEREGGNLRSNPVAFEESISQLFT